MKAFGKIFSLIIVLLILCFTILSVNGFGYYYGDNKVTVLKGVKDLKASTDLAGGIKYTLAPATADETDNIMNVLEDRAVAIGLTDYKMYVQDSTDNIIFIIPNSVDSDFSANEVLSYITCRGNVSIRPDKMFSFYDIDSSNGIVFEGKDGVTAESEIMNSEYIEGAEVSTEKVEGTTFNYVDIKFNSEGSELLSQLTDPSLVGTGVPSQYNSVVSIWIDDKMLSYPTLSEHLDSGELSFTHDSFTYSKAELYAAVINSGPMPCDVNLISSYVIPGASSVSGNSPLMMIMIIAGVILLALSFVFIYRYRLNGIVSIVCVLFQFSVILSILTGFFPHKDSFIVNIPSLCGYAFALLLTVFSTLLIFETTRSNLQNGKTLAASLDEGFKSNRTRIFDVNVLCIIVSLVGMVMFGTSDFTLNLLGNAVNGGVYKFSYVLLLGSLINFISGYFLPELLARNLKNFKFLSKPSLSGGKQK